MSSISAMANDVTRNSRKEWGLVAVILVAATLLRLYKLDSGLWLDEIFTYMDYARLPFSDIMSTYESENQHFLYSLMAHASFMLFGESAWALRLPAVLFGVGSLLALYLFGREVVTSREAVLATALVAFSYHHVWFSQNARGYTGLLFWTLLSSWFMVRALREARSGLWLLYAVAAALGVYTHLTMLFVIAGQFGVCVIRIVRRSSPVMSLISWRGPLAGFALTAALVVAIHAPALPQMIGRAGREVSTVTEWKNPLWTLFEFVRALRLGLGDGFILALGLAVFGAGMIGTWRTSPTVIELFLLPVVLGAGTVVAMGHHLWPRFFFFSLGFAILAVIRGVMITAQLVGRVLRTSRATAERMGILLCIALLLVSASTVPSAFGPKQDYEGALAFVQSEQGPQDTIVVVGVAAEAYARLFDAEWQHVESIRELELVRSTAKRTWLLYTLPPQLEAEYPDIMATIQKEFEPVASFPGTLGGGEVFIYRSDLSGAPDELSIVTTN